MKIKIFQAIFVIKVWQITVVLCKLDSPQIKQDLISSVITFRSQPSRELSRNLILRIIGNQEIIGKGQNRLGQRPVSSFSSRNQLLATFMQKLISNFFGLVKVCLIFVLFAKHFDKDYNSVELIEIYSQLPCR